MKILNKIYDIFWWFLESPFDNIADKFIESCLDDLEIEEIKL